jgi:alpha-D-ribose 1-methylphosphonate 5-triphosphate diphosphatase
MPGITITNGRVLRGGALHRTALYLNDGLIAERPLPMAEKIDARGALVLPGIVDLHGDGFERQIMPRNSVQFDTVLALLDTDRQLVSNGITTAWHGVSVSWEPGLRSLSGAEDIVSALRTVRPRLGCDTRLHLRWETFAAGAMAAVIDWLHGEERPILAFNDHTTGMFDGPDRTRKITRAAARTGLSREAYEARLSALEATRDRVPGDVAEMAQAGLAAGAVLLAHDETSPEERARFRALGATISEFPLNAGTADAARSMGEHTVLGAPNVLRGRSHTGALCATDAIRTGRCTVLASDYYYPAPLQAPFLLAANDVLSFEDAWALVSTNPAEAVGMSDRGRLEPGLRGDVVLVDDTDPTRPLVRNTLAGGRVVGAWGG